MQRMFVVTAILVSSPGFGCGGPEAPPIQGQKRNELCRAVEESPPFACPTGTNRRGKPPPDGAEMWCQRRDGTRHGPYRRFPDPDATVEPPAFVGEGVVVGEYREGTQHGPWWTRRAGAPAVKVAYYQRGAVAQRISCRP